MLFSYKPDCHVYSGGFREGNCHSL